MNNDANDNKQYSLEDIRNYFLGEMSSFDMHALEKAALNDPFLADAMEGIEADMRRDPDAFRSAISDLRKKLDQRTKQKPIAAWWKVAAAVTILAAGGILTFVFTESSGDKMMVKVEERSASSAPPQKEPETKVLTDSAARDEASDLAKNIPKPQRSREKFEELRSPSSATIDSSQSILSTPAFSQDTIKQDAYELAKQAPQPALQKQETVSRALSGKVEGVTIDSAATINEVVVVGYGTKKKKTISNQSVSSRNQKNIAPDGGWIKFDEYVRSNKQIHGKAADLSGKEIILFTIDQNGRPTQINVRKSLSAQHDAEAIRLVQNGPAWKVLKGNRRKVKLTILF